MKVDVCVSFYRRRNLWPLVEAGLRRAADHISRIIVVNAERWDWLPTSFGVPIQTLTELPKRPTDFNYSAMVNTGIRYATSDYVVHLDDDVVLTANTLPRLLHDITPTSFHTGTCHSAPEDSELDEIDDDEPQTVWRNSGVPEGLFSGPLWAVHRETFLRLGGFDERLTEYANQDGEFIRRWMISHGYGSCKLTNAVAYQLEPLTPKPPRPKPVDPYFNEIMLQRWAELEAKWGPYRGSIKRESV